MKTKRDQIQERISNLIINNNMLGIVDVAPRTGKIKIVLNCLNDKDSIIIAYPESTIKNSWKNDIKKWKFKNKKVSYTTYMSFSKINNPCDVLILDEVHDISDAQIDAISKYIKKFNIKKIIALTGTLTEKTKLKLFANLSLSVIAKYSIEEAVEDGIVTDYKIDIYKTPLSTNKNIKVKWSGGEFMSSEKLSFDSLSKKIDDIKYIDFKSKKVLKFLRLTRMRIFKSSQAKIDLTKKILNDLKNNRVLVFTGLTEVADSLGIESYHSKNKNEIGKDRFINGKSKHLAVVNKLKAGITFPKLNTVILNSFDSNSENTAQKISRATCMEYDNPDKVAHIIIITTNEPIELEWLKKTLEFFDDKKIFYHE
jgi:superfamily II DNA or RNA helicase